MSESCNQSTTPTTSSSTWSSPPSKRATLPTFPADPGVVKPRQLTRLGGQPTITHRRHGPCPFKQEGATGLTPVGPEARPEAQISASNHRLPTCLGVRRSLEPAQEQMTSGSPQVTASVCRNLPGVLYAAKASRERPRHPRPRNGLACHGQWVPRVLARGCGWRRPGDRTDAVRPVQTSSGTSRCARTSSNPATSTTRMPVSCTRSARIPMAVSAAFAIAWVES